MVAALATAPATCLPLLLEPVQPGKQGNPSWVYGWRRVQGAWVRCHGDDAIGALVQHAIVRYIVHGVSRQDLAREIGYSERQVQAWVCGRANTPYAEVVRQRLHELGISVGKGRRHASATRMLEVVAAYEALLEEAADHLWLGTESGQYLQATIRLLLAGRDPLPLGGVL